MQVQRWAAHFERGRAVAPRSALRARRLALERQQAVFPVPAGRRGAPTAAAVAELQRPGDSATLQEVGPALLPARVVSFPQQAACGRAAVLVRRAPHSARVSDPDAFQVPDPDAFAEHLRPAAGVVQEVVLASRVAAARQRQAEAREAALALHVTVACRQQVVAVVPLDASVVRQEVEAVGEAVEASDVPLLAAVPAVALVSDAPEEPQPVEAAVLDVQEALPPVAEAAVSDARAAEPREVVLHAEVAPLEAVVLRAVAELREAAVRDAAVPPQAAARRVAQAVVPAAVPSAAAWVFRQGRLRRPAVAQRPVALSVHWMRRSQTAPPSAWWSQAAQDEVWS
jgi:hypothetical protein